MRELPAASSSGLGKQVRERRAQEHLNICGLNNLVHSVSLVAQALAAVAEEPKAPDQIRDVHVLRFLRVGMSSAAC